MTTQNRNLRERFQAELERWKTPEGISIALTVALVLSFGWCLGGVIGHLMLGH